MNTSRRSLSCVLAEAFLAGPLDLERMVERATLVLGKRYRWVRPLARRVLAAFGGGARIRSVRVAEFVGNDTSFQRACEGSNLRIHFARWAKLVMTPASGPPALWSVPAITTSAELASFLDIDPSELDWFADIQRRERTSRGEALRHYRYRWVAKPSGSFRLIEAPKPRLKAFQRRILDEILGHVPPHDSAHGFRPGRSITTFAAPHVGQAIVLKMDLRDFFVSITSARVTAIYLTAGYPEPVARLLSRLCTNTVPPQVMHQVTRAAPDGAGRAMPWQDQRPCACPHLPQGSLTSAALANLAAYRFDARLAALSTAAGAVYTRYADDLVFSGGHSFARSIQRFSTQVAAVAIEEGFALQHRKTRIMRQGVRQRVAGVVINQKINMARDDYDRLKAILCNCMRHGPSEQNRSKVADFRAHLAGRVAQIKRLNPDRGDKLARLFEQIRW
jgi:RNA-directed DNA polymerase